MPCFLNCLLYTKPHTVFHNKFKEDPGSVRKIKKLISVIYQAVVTCGRYFTLLKAGFE